MQGRTPLRGRTEPDFSLVLPTYNPGSRLETTWRALESFLPTAPGTWEVLFVCDGCTDGTPERLHELTQASVASIRVLRYAPNRGKGYAVRHGMLHAHGAYRLFTDVDLAYGWTDVVRVAQALEAGAEVVIGSRSHPASHVTMPVVLQGYIYRRHIQSQVFGALARLLLPLTQRDLQAGLKGLSARAAALVLPHLRCDGFGFDCELLTACVRFGLGITEVPVHVYYEDRVSTTSVQTMGRMVRDLWRIRRAWRQAPTPLSVDVPKRDAA